MVWQDIVIMVACFGFAVALIPSIRGDNKPAKSSCLLTAMLLSAIAVCFATMRYWLSFTAETTSIAAWLILYHQQRRKNV